MSSAGSALVLNERVRVLPASFWKISPASSIPSLSSMKNRWRPASSATVAAWAGGHTGSQSVYVGLIDEGIERERLAMMGLGIRAVLQVS